MIQFGLEKDCAQRIIESLIRMSEAYQQRAVEYELKGAPSDLTKAYEAREKSRLAAYDASLMQRAILDQQGG